MISKQENLFYLTSTIITTIILTWNPISTSLPSKPWHSQYSKLLSKGWIPFLKEFDNSDLQYASFRGNVPILIPVALLHLYITKNDTSNLKKWKNVIFSLIFLTILNGSSIIFMFLQLFVFYGIGMIFGKDRLNPILTWIFAIIFLFSNDHFHGYVFPKFFPFNDFFNSHRGIVYNWFVTWNFTILRCISFNLDYYWYLNGRDEENLKRHEENCRQCLDGPCSKARPMIHPRESNPYSLSNHLCYTLYVPLFLAGPIISFNDFMHQLSHPSNIQDKVKYTLRWISLFLLFEIILHVLHSTAIGKSTILQSNILTPSQTGTLCFWNLEIIWFKLTIIWRFFRTWALWNDFDTEENMGRCMSNNYSSIEFWRAWHKSFNRWLIRYMYIPLNGYENKIWVIPIIFMFVAFWHDRTLQLLTWSWLIIFFLLPEGILRYIISKNPKRYKSDGWIRFGGFLASLNILMMITANTVGFAVGIDGTMAMIDQIFSFDGLWFLLASILTLYCFTMTMFDYRLKEQNQGIHHRY